jgi:molecular chaperone DnaK (HSP70)
MISYNSDGSNWIGAQVINKQASAESRTFRLMKTYLTGDLVDTPRQVRSELKVTSRAAAEKFLTVVLEQVQTTYGPIEGLCFTLPVGVPAHYGEWLMSLAQKLELPVPVLLDEPTAASVGYQASIKVGEKFLAIDFGGGTLDVAFVELMDSDSSTSSVPKVKTLGLSGADIGGSEIDMWISEAVLSELEITDEDAGQDGIMNDLLLSAEMAKEQLSFIDESQINAINPSTGSIVTFDLTRADFETLLHGRGLFERFDETLRTSLSQARTEGSTEADLEAVLLIGGSTLIPSVRKHVESQFGKSRIRDNRPFSAVALGAAKVAAGFKIISKTTHDYAIRYLDDNGSEQFEIIVKNGTETPIPQVWSGLITSTKKGQTVFEIAVYRRMIARTIRRRIEIMFGASGKAQLSKSTHKVKGFKGERLASTPIRTLPSNRVGETCLEISFTIDEQKRLLVTAADVRQIPNTILMTSEQMTTVD